MGRSGPDRNVIMKLSRLLVVLPLAMFPVAVATPAQAATVYTAHLDGASEVPERDTLARGQAILTVSEDGTVLQYRLIVANIDNVVASHIHLGPAGVNGPVVAFLFSGTGEGRTSGVLATGTITAADLVGPLAGHPLSDLLAALESGDAYVNVHTNDFVPPTDTGPGDFPGGEIRGQID